MKLFGQQDSIDKRIVVLVGNRRVRMQWIAMYRNRIDLKIAIGCDLAKLFARACVVNEFLDSADIVEVASAGVGTPA